MKILIIEDDARITRPVAEDLRHQNHTVDVAHDGKMGWELAQEGDYELILLDLMLPQIDGLELCRQLRSHRLDAYILMLTGRDAVTDRILGLDAGADDYLIKPFDLDELSARIRALRRRGKDLKAEVYRHGLLEVHTLGCEVFHHHQKLSLTPTEYRILEHLLRHPKQVVTRDALMNQLWQIDQVAGPDTVKTHITNLRRKLKQAGDREQIIETVYGLGYRLRPLEFH